MSPDALTVEIRLRTRWEALDLGLTLVQTYWRSLYAAWFVFIVPAAFSALLLVYFLNLGNGGDWSWCGWLLLWWLKPLYDRALLLVLSRAVFGETVGWRGVLRAVPNLLWHSGLFHDLTWRRFTPRRSFQLPIWQLEGVTGRMRRQRFRVLGRNAAAGTATNLTIVCSACETILTIGVLGFFFLLLPTEFVTSHFSSFSDIATAGESTWLALIQGLGYLLAASIVEPFYVAAGFTLYLNRRTELEGWDIELGFRTLSARLGAQQATP